MKFPSFESGTTENSDDDPSRNPRPGSESSLEVSPDQLALEVAALTAGLVTVVMGRVRERESIRPDKLRCSKCGGWFEDDAFCFDPRNANRRGRRSSCRACNAAARPPRPGTRPTRTSQEQLRQWWRDRYTQEEIDVMAAGLGFLSTALPGRETAAA